MLSNSVPHTPMVAFPQVSPSDTSQAMGAASPAMGGASLMTVRSSIPHKWAPILYLSQACLYSASLSLSTPLEGEYGFKLLDFNSVREYNWAQYNKYLSKANPEPSMQFNSWTLTPTIPLQWFQYTECFSKTSILWSQSGRYTEVLL